MDNTEQIPALDAEGKASPENSSSVLDHQNASTNQFQFGVEYISEDNPSSNIEELAIRERFEDNTSGKDMSKASSPSETEDTTDEKRPPTQTQNNNNIRQSVSEREIQNLRSSNLPGLSELGPLRSTRNRGPSYHKAKSTFDDAFQSIIRELTEFDAQKYYNESPESLPQTDIRSRYRKVHMRKHTLMTVMEDI